MTFKELKAGQFFVFPKTNGMNDIFFKTIAGFIRIPNIKFSSTDCWDERYSNSLDCPVIKVSKTKLFKNIVMVK